MELIAEESYHYSADEPASRREWDYHRPTSHGGVVRIGPHNRTFYVSSVHQLHCLQTFFWDLAGITHVSLEHHQHCLNYLRQRILCDADLTLETGDYRTRDFGKNRQGATFVCRDWEAVIDAVTLDWLKWNRYRVENNITSQYPLLLLSALNCHLTAPGSYGDVTVTGHEQLQAVDEIQKWRAPP